MATLSPRKNLAISWSLLCHGSPLARTIHCPSISSSIELLNKRNGKQLICELIQFGEVYCLNMIRIKELITHIQLMWCAFNSGLHDGIWKYGLTSIRSQRAVIVIVCARWKWKVRVHISLEFHIQTNISNENGTEEKCISIHFTHSTVDVVFACKFLLMLRVVYWMGRTRESHY